MALDPSTAPSLTSFSLLSFDIFGTLIDDRTGIATALQPLISRLPLAHPAKASSQHGIEAIERLERAIHQSSPSLGQDKILARAYEQLADEWGVEDRVGEGEAEAFARSMGDWAPFSDTVDAMRVLAERYKLVALSNVDQGTIARTLSGPLAEVRFDAVYTAEDIGSYKPDLRNFEYLLSNVRDKFGVEKEQLLHVAQGLGSDHIPAKKMGMWSAWIARGRGEGEKAYEGVGVELGGKVGYQWRWATLGDMARDVERAFGERSKG